MCSKILQDVYQNNSLNITRQSDHLALKGIRLLPMIARSLDDILVDCTVLQVCLLESLENMIILIQACNTIF